MKINQIGRFIGIIHRQSQINLNQQIKLPNIKATNAVLLLFIRDYEKVTARQISKNLAINKGLVSRELAGLEDFGYINRLVNRDDHRLSWITLTDKGRDACAVIDRIMEDWWKQLLIDNNSENKTVVYQELEKIARQITGEELLVHPNRKEKNPE
ncbi:hypothetical protein FCS83_00425 [Oenococcus sp. UCMA 17063]|nr:hypothetical protein [Oenococcus sp. UCMA 17063]